MPLEMQLYSEVSKAAEQAAETTEAAGVRARAWMV